MPIPVPTPNQFSLVNTVADAISFINDLNGIWLLLIGMGIGVAVVGLVMKAVREVMP